MPSLLDFISASTFPASLTVSGAGDSAYNGVYPQAGTVNGAPYYQLDGSHFLFFDGGSWGLSDSLSNGGPAFAYTSASGGTAAAVELGTYNANTGSTPHATVS